MLFTNSNIIGCYYHFKAALVRKAREMRYLKKDKKNTKILIDILGKLPLLYDGSETFFNNYIEKYKHIFSKEYINYINYFIIQWKNYFIKETLYYNKYKKIVRSNC